VFTARYALSPYTKQIRFLFKGLNYTCQITIIYKLFSHINIYRDFHLLNLFKININISSIIHTILKAVAIFKEFETLYKYVVIKQQAAQNEFHENQSDTRITFCRQGGRKTDIMRVVASRKCDSKGRTLFLWSPESK
jgi:hypothetical protein